MYSAYIKPPMMCNSLELYLEESTYGQRIIGGIDNMNKEELWKCMRWIICKNMELLLYWIKD